MNTKFKLPMYLKAFKNKYNQTNKTTNNNIVQNQKKIPNFFKQNTSKLQIGENTC